MKQICGQPRHLELLKLDDQFFIQINSMVGRLSLFADHPQFKLKEALNLNHKMHRTSGNISLVSTRKKGLFILEDVDALGNKTQNFIYANDEISSSLKTQIYSQWLKEHVQDFFTRSISVAFFVIYMIYFFSVMRYYNTTGILHVLRYITGVITLAFALGYYYLRSSKTKSSFLRFCFKTELVIFVLVGTISNIQHLIYLNSATDTF